MRVEVHKLEQAGTAAEQPIDITDRVQRLSVTTQLTRPWQTIGLRFLKHKSVPLALGDYVVIRDHTANAFALGIVPDMSRDLSVRGTAISASGFDVQAVCPYEYLGQIQTAVLDGGLRDRGGETQQQLGTLMTFSEWKDLLDIFNTARSTEYPGSVLGELLTSPLARLRLPGSLQASAEVEWLGRETAVVYDTNSRDQFAPGIAMEPVRGAIPDVASPLQSDLDTLPPPLSGLLSVLQGDDRLVEAFPALVSADQPSTPMATKLGRNYVWVYRLKPWRVEPLSEWIPEHIGEPVFSSGSQNASLLPDNFTSAETGGVDASYRAAVQAWSSPRKVWGTGSPWRAHEDGVSVQLRQTLADAWTAVHVRMPGFAQPKFFAANGFPIRAKSELSANLPFDYGLRLLEVQWPLIRYEEAQLGFAYALGCLAAHFYLGASRFSSGTARMHYTPQARPGEVCTLPTPAGELVAYTEAVTHTRDVGDRGEVSQSTSIRFSRGRVDAENGRAIPVVRG